MLFLLFILDDCVNNPRWFSTQRHFNILISLNQTLAVLRTCTTERFSQVHVGERVQRLDKSIKGSVLHIIQVERSTCS